MMCAEPGTMPTRKPSTEPRAIGAADCRHSSRVGISSREARADHLAGDRLARRRQDLAEAEQPHGHRHDADAVAQLLDVEAVAEVPGHHVDADARRAAARCTPSAACARARSTTCRRGTRGRARAARCTRAARSAARSWRAAAPPAVSMMTPNVPATNEPTAAMASAAPARPLLRHGVAVDAGHDRGRLAGDAHQDRGGRAAVLRAVVDAGQHHDGLGGIEAEGGRQQDGDAGERADARQHADERADQAAEESIEQHVRAEGDREAEQPGCRGWLPCAALEPEHAARQRRLRAAVLNSGGRARSRRC